MTRYFVVLHWEWCGCTEIDEILVVEDDSITINDIEDAVNCCVTNGTFTVKEYKPRHFEKELS